MEYHHFQREAGCIKGYVGNCLESYNYLKTTQQFHMQVLFCVEEAASDVHLFLYVGCSMNLLLRKMSTGAALVKKI